jgi:hypothetical protein
LRDSGARALVIHADLLEQIQGAVPPNVTVIVVEPSTAVQRASGGVRSSRRRMRAARRVLSRSALLRMHLSGQAPLGGHSPGRRSRYWTTQVASFRLARWGTSTRGTRATPSSPT